MAIRGLGNVRPNPVVGCVIVREGRVIGEGWHRYFGGPHAEVAAVESVSNREMLKGSTVYVNLEPCAFHGKTPPCANMLVEKEVGRVVFSNIDPNPKVKGKGAGLLKGKNIEVVDGVLEDEGRELNKRFFTVHERKRPYIVLKWAQTADGFIAHEDGSSKWISNKYSRMIVHKWRSEEHAILVGSRTVKYDDPSLTVRDWPGKSPLRIVMGNGLADNSGQKVFDNSVPTIVYNTEKSAEQEGASWVKIVDKDLLAGALDDLMNRDIQSVFVEGGAKTLQTFIDKGLWDEARVFTGPGVFGTGINAPELRATPVDRREIHGDILTVYKPTTLG